MRVRSSGIQAVVKHPCAPCDKPFSAEVDGLLPVVGSLQAEKTLHFLQRIGSKELMPRPRCSPRSVVAIWGVAALHALADPAA